MDFEDRSEKLKQWTAKGVRFVRDRVTEKNLGSLLGAFVGAGDIIIRPRVEHRCLRHPRLVPPPRRALRQHLHRVVGPYAAGPSSIRRRRPSTGGT